MPLLSATGLVKVHGRGRAARRILDGAELVVERGELVTVTGRSGSGKSTLLNLLGGLDWPQEGEVRIDGRPLHARAERQAAEVRGSSIGFVFQSFHLVPELSGRHNVLLPTRVGTRRNGNGGERRADALIEQLGLSPIAAQRPHELSGGEQQRFAIARALVNDPPIVLADEPTGNLDAESGALVLDLLAGMAGARAVILATHDEAAVSAADRRLRLVDGQLRPE